ncbi:MULTISPECIES: type II secretion system F family protein [Vibrio]|uniref:Type II secretion system F family protein n=1 Tax=Vibrio ostreae TaxID=2841925 RepID=A0A975YMP8_9VIBR|nr:MULTISPECIES: type II secretion system F family protein [Vibrio]QXO16849.1 type II secretion system F family protein [Vibrio ostreae]
MQEQYLYFLGFLFIAVVFISQAFLLPTAGKKAKHSVISKRLKESQDSLDPQNRSLLNEQYLKSLSPLDRKLVSISSFSVMKKNLELAGLNWSLSQTVMTTLLVEVCVLLLLMFFGVSFVIAFAVSLLVWLFLYVFIQKKIAARLAKFEEQFPEALDIMKRMLLAGNPITQAFNEVGNELEAPIGSEFKNTFNLLNYGYDIRLAIMQMVERNPTVSMFAFSSAVLLQKETGGNLTENLDKVSQVLRARFKLSRKIKTLSAESKMSAWILMLVPFVMFGVLSLISPDFVEPLFNDPRGIKMALLGLVGMILGALWIKKIINFEV